MFISWPHTYTVRVFSSLVKTKHKAVTARTGGDQLIGCSRQTVYVYDQRPHHIDKLRQSIGTFDWTEINSCKDITDKYSKFLNVVTDLMALWA